MELLILKLAQEVPELVEQGIRLRHFGKRDRFSSEVIFAIDQACKATETGENLTIGLALDYSGRSEISHAVQSILTLDCMPHDIDETLIESHLYTAGMPDPDLLIRTAGEMRVSNFLLWQIAYSEIYVTEQCWPEFDGRSLDLAIEDFQNRNRTYGNVK